MIRSKVLSYMAEHRPRLKAVWRKAGTMDGWFNPGDAKMSVLGIVARGVCTSVHTVEKSLRAYGFEHDLWHMEDIIANLLEEDKDV